MILEFLRLALATALVLLPGRLISRAFGQRSASATLAWAFAAIFVAWAVVFVVHGTIWLALAVLAAIGVGAAFARKPVPLRPEGSFVLLGFALVLGLLLWTVSDAVVGDALFHMGRVRKLLEFGDLHLRTVDEFKDGGLHPGYAFPLWHGFLAMVAQVAFLDPATVMRHEASLLAPLACVIAWESGIAVFGVLAGGLTVLMTQVALFCLAPGHGGAYADLALPGTASRQLFAPAAITLFFTYLRSRSPPVAVSFGAAVGAIAFVHPTYALFLLVPLCAYTLVQWRDWRSAPVALGCAFVPTILILLWLRPIVEETVSVGPDAAERMRSLRHYASQLTIFGEHDFRLRPEVLGRGGSVAVAALLLVPLAALALRRRWAAYVLAGTVSIVALMLVPWLFVHLSDAASLSQSRRAAGFAPLPFALAGGAALLARSKWLSPLALLAGIVLQWAWPGDFAYGLHSGGPALAAWIALGGGAAALVFWVVASAVWGKPLLSEKHELAELFIALFILPVAVHAALNWTPLVRHDPHELPPGLLQALRERVPKGSVVVAPLEESYRISAYTPLYVVAAPPAHVADTAANRPYQRRRDVMEWLRTKNPEIPERYGATWAVDQNGRLYRLAR